MRIRLPFAGGFFLLLLVAGYVGLSSLHLDAVINDKLLHTLTFFALTVVFYWIIDTSSRRRILNLTLVVCTGALGVGSEILQASLPNGRSFDGLDIVANVVGSLGGLGLCSWYHTRMLERRRQRRAYGAVPGDEAAADERELGEGEHDLELGEGVVHNTSTGNVAGHEEGGAVQEDERAVSPGTDAQPQGKGNGSASAGMTLEEDVDTWDENAADAWEEDDLGDVGASSHKGGDGPKQRVD